MAVEDWIGRAPPDTFTADPNDDSEEEDDEEEATGTLVDGDGEAAHEEEQQEEQQEQEEEKEGQQGELEYADGDDDEETGEEELKDALQHQQLAEAEKYTFHTDSKTAIELTMAEAHAKGFLKNNYRDHYEPPDAAKIYRMGEKKPNRLHAEMVMGAILTKAEIDDPNIGKGRLQLFLTTRRLKHDATLPELIKRARAVVDKEENQLQKNPNYRPTIYDPAGVCHEAYAIARHLINKAEYPQFNDTKYRVEEQAEKITDMETIQKRCPYLSEAQVTKHYSHLGSEQSKTVRVLERGWKLIQTLSHIDGLQYIPIPNSSEPKISALRLKVPASMENQSYFVTIFFEWDYHGDIVPGTDRPKKIVIIGRMVCQPVLVDGPPCKASGESWSTTYVFADCSHCSAGLQVILNLQRDHDFFFGTSTTAFLCWWNSRQGYTIYYDVSKPIYSFPLTKPNRKRTDEQGQWCSVRTDYPRGQLNPFGSEACKTLEANTRREYSDNYKRTLENFYKISRETFAACATKTRKSDAHKNASLAPQKAGQITLMCLKEYQEHGDRWSVDAPTEDITMEFANAVANSNFCGI